MRLFELILQNVSPQKIARDIAAAIASATGGNVISVTTKHFLHSIMDAIGFNYYVTMNEISNMDFEWPVDAVFYQFHYQPDVFDRFQHFLKIICEIMNQKELLEPLIKIIEVFLSFYDSLEESSLDNFREPLSLICYSLLQSMHKIRKSFTDENLVLDSICHKLFENSQKGLGFSDSHQTIFKGLCELLVKDYSYFSYYDENIFKFYSNCMEYEISKASCQLFTYMKRALENTSASSREKTNLVNYLTDSKMIKAYCVFAQQFSNNQVCSLLKFLNSLLGHLPVLECFSRDQVHIIFCNALHKSETVRLEAVKFYLLFMRKSFTDKFILRDILDFFLIKSNGIDSLDCFIETLWNEFPYMTELDPYLKILQKADWDLGILSVAAQFSYRVYQRLYVECESNDEYPLRLSKFLLKLPSLLMLLKEKWQIRGILSNIYSITDPLKAIFTIKEFPIAADRYTRYALRFLKKDGEDSSIIQNTVHNMLKIMDHYNMQEEMEQFANNVFVKYKQLVSNLSELTERQVIILQNTMVILSNLIDGSFLLSEENLVDLLTDLATRLIYTKTFEELSAQFGCSLDALAITTYSGCLNILSIMCEQITPDETNTESKVLLNQVNPFLKYLLDHLKNSKLSNVTIVFIEAAIRAFCDLFIVFNFKLERNVYHILVDCVHLHVFEAPVASDRLRQLELQRNMLHCFNLMHKLVEIPVAITWKIVIHFGVAPQFQAELTEIMDTLFEYNSDRFKKPSLFTYVVPVAIYNLFQRKTPFKKCQKALRAHKSYVEAKLTGATQRIMKIHIVLTMVDMIERAIKAGTLNNQSNRLELLSQMNILLTDIYQSESNLIYHQTRKLENHSLTQNELQTLNSFQGQLT